MVMNNICKIDDIKEFDEYGRAKILIGDLRAYDEFYIQIINSGIVFGDNKRAWVNDYYNKYNKSVYAEFTRKYNYVHNAVIIDVEKLHGDFVRFSFGRNLQSSEVIYKFTKNSYSVDLI